MVLKKWPYWVKGGVMAFVVVLIDILLLYLCDIASMGESYFGCGLIFISLGPLMPVSIALRYIDLDISSEPVFYAVSIVVWFLIGALIGWLYGWYKKKRE